MSNQAGKGDKPRPTNKVKYVSNYDSIEWGADKSSKKPFKVIKGKIIYRY